jgi:type VI secretion system secreted protein VgrG
MLLSVENDVAETIGGRVTVSAGKDWIRSIGGNLTEKVSKACMLNANKIIFSAKDEMSLEAGKASIILKKNGDINIKGKSITITGSGDVVIKGKKVLSK